MNYYKQGDAANADKIKAAFEKKGIDTSDWEFINPCDLYFNVGSEIYTIDYKIKHIVTGRSDYTHLELPVEPKFKVGDTIKWIDHDAQEQTIIDIKKDNYITVDKYGIRCALKFAKQDEWELVPKPHYDISNFKPFDKVLLRDDDNECWMPSLFGWFDSGLQDGKFVCGTSDWYQCIPFNEETKHLLGTTEPCGEEFINW